MYQTIKDLFKKKNEEETKLLEQLIKTQDHCIKVKIDLYNLRCKVEDLGLDVSNNCEHIPIKNEYIKSELVKECILCGDLIYTSKK